MRKIASVIVTYNRSELLKECISALVNLNTTTDIFVVDNASTDNTEEIVVGFIVDNKNVFYYKMQNNIGGAGGFNYGIRKAYEAGYEYIWLMDDDTIVKSDTLEELLKIGDSVDNNFGWLSSLALWTDGKECVMNWHDVDKEWNCDKKGILEGRLLCQGATFVSLLIHRKAVSECGLPIKEYFIWGDDTEYTQRIAQEFPCYFAPRSQVIHKMKSNEGTGRFEEIENIDRIERMYYSIRNDFCTYKRKGVIQTIKFVYGEMKVFKRVIFSNRRYKWKKVWVMLKGLWAGIWFHPKIEKVH